MNYLETYLQTLPPLKRTRASLYLTKMQRSIDFGVTSIAEYVELRLKKENYVLKIKQVPKLAPLTRLQFFRATNEEQRRHEKAILASGLKNEYYIGLYMVVKTEYDYASFILLMKNSVTIGDSPSSVKENVLAIS